MADLNREEGVGQEVVKLQRIPDGGGKDVARWQRFFFWSRRLLFMHFHFVRSLQRPPVERGEVAQTVQFAWLRQQPVDMD
jgi:hypothetical protein